MVNEIKCDNKNCKKHKCVADQTFVIIPKNRQYKFAFMISAHCPICKKHFTLITNYKFIKEGEKKVKQTDKKPRAFGIFEPVFKLFTGKKADKVFEDIFEKQKAVIYEVLKNSANHKSGFYLNYTEYGSVKRCYSNLSTLKLGRIKNNFEDMENMKKILI